MLYYIVCERSMLLSAVYRDYNHLRTIKLRNIARETSKFRVDVKFSFSLDRFKNGMEVVMKPLVSLLLSSDQNARFSYDMTKFHKLNLNKTKIFFSRQVESLSRI